MNETCKTLASASQKHSRIKKYRVDIQHVSEDTLPISDQQLINWIELTLIHTQPLTSFAKYWPQCGAELTIRLVDKPEITTLNTQYRQQAKATNVLAFPSTIPSHIKLKYIFLGDLVICPAVLYAESFELNTPLIAHWAHIVIHGVLHLIGYDHMNPADEQKMQHLEIQLLQQLGYDNPYHKNT